MIYKGEYLNEISFPIGGIGSGSFGIAGNGRFIDWEIFNRPAKGTLLGFTHIAVKAKTPDKTYVKILNGDLTKELSGSYDRIMFSGFGHGPRSNTMAGHPHFRNIEFDGEFPIAKLTFSDPDFPGKIVLTAFNPFIPLDSYNSSLPAGFFNVEFINDTDEDIEFYAYFSLGSHFDRTVNEKVTSGNMTGVKITSVLDKESLEYGDMTLATLCKNTTVQRYWYRGGWQDGIDVFTKELHSDKPLMDRVYDNPEGFDTASLQTCETAKKGESANIKFVLTWNMPNTCNYIEYLKHEDDVPWKNYYATVFESSYDSAAYCAENFESLYERTLAFKNVIFNSTLDEKVIEALSSTMSVLKTATVLRLQDGSFYGWEGVHETAGSCEGTCQHVWNYAYALCFLFPDLERSIRDNEYTYCMHDNGKTVFRISLPLGAVKTTMRACVDGQMGLIFKTYREWKLSGNTEWLRGIWDKVKTVLAYAWNEENPDKWDFDRDGVLEGRQHHTLDMELFGPSGWLEGMYLCALRAATEMAEFLGDTEAAKDYTDLFNKGKEWTKNNLFNGEYFIQKLDLYDTSYIDKFDCPNYLYNETGELKYQMGNGCSIDQVLGQWHSNLIGLGEIFEKDQLMSALRSIYKYNYKCMRDNVNTWRVYGVNDEKGAIMCSFPKDKPTIAVPYHTELMTGFEYSLAGLMISEGMEEEGLTIVRSVRDRYDGKKRNPWNEIECGNNYARAMASFALSAIYSGLKFDLPRKSIGFDPIHKENFKGFYSVGTAWGALTWNAEEARMDITEGYFDLTSFMTSVVPQELYLDGNKVDFTVADGKINFNETKVTKSIALVL